MPTDKAPQLNQLQMPKQGENVIALLWAGKRAFVGRVVDGQVKWKRVR